MTLEQKLQKLLEEVKFERDQGMYYPSSSPRTFAAIIESLLVAYKALGDCTCAFTQIGECDNCETRAAVEKLIGVEI